MAPRKKAPTPEGNTDSESDVHQSPTMPPGLELMVENIDRIRGKRTQIRKDIEHDFMKSVSSMKSRITKHYKAEKAERSKVMLQKMDRLQEAVDKQVACEHVIENIISSLLEEGKNLATLMDAVHTGRRKAADAGVTPGNHQEKVR
ncbi:hypothetical protein SCUP234_00774 [Seiridium cupressi]